MNENNQEILLYKDKLLKVHNKTVHLILSPNCFKKSLMMIRTEKANQIRDYYIEIEEICLEFNKFLLQNHKLQLQEAENILNLSRLQLEEEKEKNIITVKHYTSESIFYFF